jgi:hypothetical protein
VHLRPLLCCGEICCCVEWLVVKVRQPLWGMVSCKWWRLRTGIYRRLTTAVGATIFTLKQVWMDLTNAGCLLVPLGANTLYCKG